MKNIKFEVVTFTSGKCHCHFSRQLVCNDSVSISVESVVSVLHYLYSGVPHEVHVKYQF